MQAKSLQRLPRQKLRPNLKNNVSFRTDCLCLTLISTCWNWKRMRRSSRIASFNAGFSGIIRSSVWKLCHQLGRKIAVDLCRWLKTCVVEPCQRLNYHICLIIYWILRVMRKYWDYTRKCAEDIYMYIRETSNFILKCAGSCGEMPFENEFISLTDIARYKSDDPTAVIQNWMRNRDDMVEQQT